jgi:dolichol-phosphate mannosyltransferase
MSEPRGEIDVSVVIPTRNEAPNLRALLPRLLEAFRGAGLSGEVVVADDGSPDGTADAAEALLGAGGRVLRRTGTPGLAPAVIEGLAAAGGRILCVMDADLSHPPELVPALVRAVREGADLAVASRYVPGGGVEGWPWRRRWMSRAACWLARPLTPVRDATSGFFCLRRSVIEGVPLTASGFKIGLEVFVKGRHARLVEVPYVFRDRTEGTSKLGSRVMLQYLGHLARLAAWRILRRRT